jgi:GNAT superfamily N-acetyltransferase
MTTERAEIRFGRPGDAEVLANLVRELAVYEELEQFAQASPQALERDLFGPHPAADTLIAEVGGAAVGFALFFPTYSTFRGQPGMYLEDLFVQPPYRGRGIGKALLATVARIATERGCGRLEWAVLDWNKPAIGFYRALGAEKMDEWTVYRLADASLERLASAAPAIDSAGGERSR